MSSTKRVLSAIVLPLGLAVLLSSCSSIQFLSEISKPRVSPANDQLPEYGKRYKVGLPYVIKGRKYFPKVDYDYVETGLASWYGPQFHGKQTANGAKFNMYAVSAAHRTLPLPSFVEVENLDNGRKLVVLVNDRGPFHGNRILDVSMRAAEILGFKNKGVTRVKVSILANESRHLAAQIQTGKTPAPLAVAQQSAQNSITTRANSNTVTLTPANSGTAVTVQKVVRAPLKKLALKKSANAFTPPVAGTYVQIAALSQYDTALIVRRKVIGFNATIGLARSADPGSGTLYKVLIGPFNSAADATRVKDQLQRSQFPGAHIVSWQL